MIENIADKFSDVDSAVEELTPFDVRDSSGKAGLLKLALGFGFLLLAALIILKIYQPGTRDRDAPPVISADNTPFKDIPENIGGQQVPNQDKSVYDVMDGKTPSEVMSPVLAAELPIEMPKAATIQVEAPSVPAVPKLAPKPAAVKISPPTTTPSKRVASGNSEWVVQVASVRSELDASQLWSNTSTKFDDILGNGLYADIKYADLAEKGVYYRLRVAGLADKDSANSLCSQFKARGQACFVTRR